MAVFGQRIDKCPGDIWITIRNKSLYLEGCKQGDWVFVGFLFCFCFLHSIVTIFFGRNVLTCDVIMNQFVLT